MGTPIVYVVPMEDMKMIPKLKKKESSYPGSIRLSARDN